jgi:C-terminal peptidase prc
MPRLQSAQDLRKAFQQFVDGSQTVEKFLEARTAILEKTKLARTDAEEYAKKVMAAASMVQRNHVQETKVSDLVNWAIRGLYRRLDEPIPQDFLDRLAKVKDLKDADLTTLVEDVRERLGKREDLDKNQDVEVSLQRMTARLDPYTAYISPERLARFDNDVTGELTGIGVQVRKDTDSDLIEIITPIRNSPAYKAGVLTGDLIAKITPLVDEKGKPIEKPETISAKGMPIADAVKRITGKKGTPIKLTLLRDGKEVELTIKRDQVETESVIGVRRKAEDDSWDFVIDPKNKIAYIRLTAFQTRSARDLEAAVKDLVKKEQIRGLVLDLRFNPGGLLGQAVRICDLFIDDGLIVKIKPRDRQDDPQNRYLGQHEGSQLDFPMAVLINGGSASASEVVGGCLQDHKRAIFVGERSFGKGSVQTIHNFIDGGKFKITTATFWRPSGKNLHRFSTAGRDDEDWGVLPDTGYEVPLTRKETDDLFEHQANSLIIPRKDKPAKEQPAFQDRQLDKALDYLREQAQLASRAQGKKRT